MNAVSADMYNEYKQWWKNTIKDIKSGEVNSTSIMERNNKTYVLIPEKYYPNERYKIYRIYRSPGVPKYYRLVNDTTIVRCHDHPLSLFINRNIGRKKTPSRNKPNKVTKTKPLIVKINKKITKPKEIKLKTTK